MRKLLVVLSATVMLVALGATAAYAPPAQRCPTPETLKFEANKRGQFTPGEKHGGITFNNQVGNTLNFTVDQGFVIDKICVKAGTTATVIDNFNASGTTTVGNFTVTSNCTVIDIEPDGDTDLWAQTGTCTVSITRNSGPGFSHITFYGDFYTAAPAAEVAVLGGVETAGWSSGGSSGGLALAGAQLILLLLLGALVGAGALALAAGRRRASRTQ
jgi:hypothetical protein